MNVKVSICVPVYNGEVFLRETILSIQNQTYKNIELLIQDNASTDLTSKIIEELQQGDPRIVVDKNEKLISMAANWNKVVKRAKGDYVLLLSADDVILPHFIEKCLESFCEDTAFVSTEHLLLTDKGTRNRKIKVKHGRRLISYQEILLKNPFSINFTLFKKTFLDSVVLPSGQLFREPFYTCDYDLWIRVSLLNISICFIKEPLAIYRVHQNSLSFNKLKMIKHTVLVLTSNSKKLSFNQNLIYKLTLLRMFTRLVILWLKSGFSNKRLSCFVLSKILSLR